MNKNINKKLNIVKLSKEKLYGITANDDGQSLISRYDIIPIQIVFSETYKDAEKIPNFQEVYLLCLNRIEGYDEFYDSQLFDLHQTQTLCCDAEGEFVEKTEIDFEPIEELNFKKLDDIGFETWNGIKKAVFGIYPYLVRRAILMRLFNNVEGLEIIDIGKNYLFEPIYTHLIYKNKEYWIRLYECTNHEIFTIQKTEIETFSKKDDDVIYHIAIPTKTCTHFIGKIPVYDKSHIAYILKEIS